MRIRRRRGSNVVEFALLFPVFVWLVTAITDYGWYFLVRTAAADAAHEAAREGAVTTVENDPVAAAKSTALSRFASTGLSLIPTPTAELGGQAPDRYVSVTVEVSVPALVGLVPCPTSATITSVMRLEDQS